MSVDPFLVGFLLVLSLLTAASLYRVYVGPTVFDRLVGVALVAVNGIVLIVVLGFVFARAALFLDIALAFALLAFLLPLALGRYFEHRSDAEDLGEDPDRGPAEQGSERGGDR
jgi:multicomponent Na+:H+ antiporter subunit F